MLLDFRALACVTSGSRHDRQAQQREPDEMVSVDKGHYVAVISADPSLVKPKLGSTADRIGWLLLSRAEKYGRRIRWQLIDKVRRVRDCEQCHRRPTYRVGHREGSTRIRG